MSVDTFCQCNSVAMVQDAATKLYRCVVEILMKDKFENGCGRARGEEVDG